MESEQIIHLVLNNIRQQHQKLMNGVAELTQRSDVSKYETVIRSVSECCTTLEQISEQLTQNRDTSSEENPV